MCCYPGPVSRKGGRAFFFIPSISGMVSVRLEGRESLRLPSTSSIARPIASVGAWRSLCAPRVRVLAWLALARAGGSAPGLLAGQAGRRHPSARYGLARQIPLCRRGCSKGRSLRSRASRAPWPEGISWPKRNALTLFRKAESVRANANPSPFSTCLAATDHQRTRIDAGRRELTPVRAGSSFRAGLLAQPRPEDGAAP